MVVLMDRCRRIANDNEYMLGEDGNSGVMTNAASDKRCITCDQKNGDERGNEVNDGQRQTFFYACCVRYAARAIPARPY